MSVRGKSVDSTSKHAARFLPPHSTHNIKTATQNLRNAKRCCQYNRSKRYSKRGVHSALCAHMVTGNETGGHETKRPNQAGGLRTFRTRSFPSGHTGYRIPKGGYPRDSLLVEPCRSKERLAGKTQVRRLRATETSVTSWSPCRTLPKSRGYLAPQLASVGPGAAVYPTL